jgi:PEP-CTERM putative exosortase interaction domain
MTIKMFGKAFVTIAFGIAQTHAIGLPFAGTVSLDTSQLSGSYELAFVLTDGSSPDDANTTVTLDTFDFGSGSAGTVDIPDPTQDVGGSFATGVFLRDSQFFGVIGTTFTAGDALSFRFTIDSSPEAGDTPDLLSLVLLDSLGNPVQTPDPDDSDAILSFEVGVAPMPLVRTFPGELTQAPLVVTSSVPEPGTLVMLIAALMASTAVRIRSGKEAL